MYRVSSSMVYNQNLSNIQMASKKMLEAQDTVATGKRDLKPSKDPDISSQVNGLKEEQQKYSMFLDNISTGLSILEGIDEHLQSLSSDITDVKTIAIQGANAVLTESDRKSLAQDVNQILESVAQSANTKVYGKSVFAGSATEVTPFNLTRDTSGQITSVSYSGNESEQSIPVGKGQDVGITLDGNFLTPLFESMIQVRDALENNDAAGLSNLLDPLSDSQESILSQFGKVGSRENNLTRLENRYTAGSQRIENTVSNLEDVDIPEAAMNLWKEESTYQSTMYVISRAFSNTLLKYLS